MVIFALTLLSYIINKIPMWVTALLSLSALYITGCVDANGALGGFANVNTILMGACFMVASGFRRTSLVKLMCDWLLKLTNGSFMKVYFAGSAPDKLYEQPDGGLRDHWSAPLRIM